MGAELRWPAELGGFDGLTGADWGAGPDATTETRRTKCSV